MTQDQTHEQNLAILKSLAGTQCLCSGPKAHAQAFCRSCYGALPEARQRSLYRMWNRGFQEAYLACVELLQARGRVG